MLKIAYHPIYKLSLPENHRFPMLKYELLPEQLIHEGTCTTSNFFEPQKPNDKYILDVHDPIYYYDLLNITLDNFYIELSPKNRSLADGKSISIIIYSSNIK